MSSCIISFLSSSAGGEREYFSRNSAVAASLSLSPVGVVTSKGGECEGASNQTLGIYLLLRECM